MGQQFAQNERSVNPGVQMPRTIDVLLDDDVARRKGTTNRIDDAWRQGIRRRMEDLGINQAELARLTGASKGAISEALDMKKGKATSRWVEAIHHALKLKAPSGIVGIEMEASSGGPPELGDAQKEVGAGTSHASPHATMKLAEVLSRLPPGGFAELDELGKRELIHAIIDGVTPQRLDETFAHLIGLKR